MDNHLIVGGFLAGDHRRLLQGNACWWISQICRPVVELPVLQRMKDLNWVSSMPATLLLERIYLLNISLYQKFSKSSFLTFMINFDFYDKLWLLLTRDFHKMSRTQTKNIHKKIPSKHSPRKITVGTHVWQNHALCHAIIVRKVAFIWIFVSTADVSTSASIQRSVDVSGHDFSARRVEGWLR